MKSKLYLISLALLVSTAAVAQTGSFKPTKPVTLIVPYSASGGTDAVGRLFAKELGELWGQSVIVENKTGANGAIGSGFVAKSEPDGHTLLLSVASITINPYVLAKLPYNTQTDFTPITTLAKPIVVMVASPKLKAKDMKDFLASAKANPGKHTFASSEPSTRLYGERLAKMANVQLVHVPYKGAGQWIADVASDTVDIGFASITSAQSMLNANRIKVLGIANPVRHKLLPDVATFSEQGVDGLDSKSWYGLFGPKKLPANIVKSIHADVKMVLNNPEVVAKLESYGAVPTGESPEEFTKRFNQDLEEYDELTRSLGIQVTTK